jgi:hypothetical protein
MEPISQAYFGIHFPDCFFRFQDFVTALGKEHGVDINNCALQIRLGDAFKVFEPGADIEALNPAVSSRYPNDPPEFFTMIHGPSDGLHWGYYFEDPQEPEYFVASYFHSEPIEFSVDGQNLFEAVRRFLEQSCEDKKDYLEIDGEDVYRKAVAELDLIRDVLRRYATREREETGRAYVETYDFVRSATAPTRDHIGVFIERDLYRPLPGAEQFLNPDFTPAPEQVERFLGEAAALLKDGFPGAALKLGKDLWCYEQYRPQSFRALETAYRALGRSTSLKLLNVAKEQYNP